MFCRAIIPKKKLRGGKLTVDDRNRNTRVSSDRVIVENVFGRVYGMFGMFSSKYSWSSDKFYSVIDFCFSIIHFHIRIHPLREQDVGYYQKVIADIMRRTDDAENIGRIRQHNNRNRRQMITFEMTEDLSDDKSYGASIDNNIRENKEMLEPTIIEQFVEDKISVDDKFQEIEGDDSIKFSSRSL